MTYKVFTQALCKIFIIGFWLALFWGSLFVVRFAGQYERTDSLSILIFPMLLDAKQFIAFERETGIKVRINYYESDRELVYKMNTTQGKGFDLIVGPDYTIKSFIKQKLVQPLDHKKLSFFNVIHDHYLNLYFDPHNIYSVPYFLSVYGLGIDPSYFGGLLPKASWKTLFEKQPQGFRVAMTDDPRRAFMLAGKSLFASLQDIQTNSDIQKIIQQLVQQKDHVEAYTDIKAEDFLAAKSCPVVVTVSPDFWRVQQEYPHLKFIVPQEGTCIALDSFVIPSASDKKESVYTLLNYIYKPEVLRHHITKYGFCSPRSDVNVDDLNLFCFDKKDFEKSEFFNAPVDTHTIEQAWIQVMTH